MQNIGLILLAFAFVFAVLYTLGVKNIGRADTLGLAIVFWIGAELLGGVGRIFPFR